MQVPLVGRRQQYAPDARAVRRDHLLTHAAHRQHVAAQRKLARHRGVRAREAARQERRQSGEH
eukprot:1600858-Prymnesium_polylepis.1